MEKYIQFKKAKASKSSHAVEGEEEVERKKLAEALGIPAQFDERYLINFSILTDKMKPSSRDTLSSVELMEFRKIIHLYVNFLQKKKYSKLVKLKQEKAVLPISKFKEEILHTVSEHNVVVIAGDTGCGVCTNSFLS